MEKRRKWPSASPTLSQIPFSRRLFKELTLHLRNFTPRLNNILILKVFNVLLRHAAFLGLCFRAVEPLATSDRILPLVSSSEISQLDLQVRQKLKGIPLLPSQNASL